jgi:hypothetical protein
MEYQKLWIRLRRINNSREFVYGAYLGRSFGASNNVEPAHNTTKVIFLNLQ